MALGNKNDISKDIWTTLANRFPHIRYMSYALYGAWIMSVIFSPEMLSFMPQIEDRGFILGYILSGLPLSICLLMAAIFDRCFDGLLHKQSFVLGMSFLASACTFLLVSQIAMPPFLGVACMIGTGIGTAYVCLRTGIVTCELTGTRALFTLGAMALLSFVICYAIKGMPLPISAIVVSALPFASAVTSLLLDPNSEPEEDQDSLIPLDKLPSGFLVRLMLVIFVFSFATGIARGFGTSQPADSLLEFEPFVAFVLVISLLVSIAIVSRKRSVNVGAIYLPLCLVMAIAMLLSSIFGRITSIQGLIVESLYDVFVLMIWCLLCELAGRISVSPTRIFGFGRFASAFGTTVGQALALFVIFYFGVEATLATAICVMASIVLILCFTLVLNAKTIEEALESLYIAHTRRSDQPKARAASVGNIAESASDVSLETTFSLIGAQYALTQREVDTFCLLARGRSVNYIAESLGIASNTAKGYTKNIYTKLDIHSRQELIDLVESQLSV